MQHVMRVLFDQSKCALEKLKLGDPFVERVVRHVVENEAHRLGISVLDPVNIVIAELMPWAIEKAIADKPAQKPGGG